MRSEARFWFVEFKEKSDPGSDKWCLQFKNWQTFFPPDWGMLRRSRCIQIFL